MQYEVFMQTFQCVDELFEYFEGLLLRKMAFLSYDILECSSLTEFINEIDIVVRFDHLHKFDYIKVIFKQFEGLYLIFCEFSEFADFNELIY